MSRMIQSIMAMVVCFAAFQAVARTGFPPIGGPGSATEQRDVIVNQQITHRGIDLGRLMNLNSSYDGYEVLEIRLETRQIAVQSTVDLTVNQQYLGTTRLHGGITVIRPRQPVVLGPFLNSVELEVSGSAHIGRATVVFQSNRLPRPTPPHRPPQRPPQDLVVEESVYKVLHGYQVTRLDELMRRRHRDTLGYQVAEVVLTMRSDYGGRHGGAEATLLVGGRPEGPTQRVSSRTRDYSFVVNQNFPFELRNLQLETYGGLTIEHITVYLVDDGQGRTPRRPGSPPRSPIRR